MTELTPLTDPSQIPANMTDDQAAEFWQTHEVTDEYLAKAGEPDDDNDPPKRTPTQSVTTSLRLERNTTDRLRRLARDKGMGYQTLLKQFVLERLYEEEKRAGVHG